MEKAEPPVYLLIVLVITVLLSPVVSHAGKGDFAIGLASGFIFSNITNHSINEDTNLSNLVYKSLPEQKQKQIESIKNINITNDDTITKLLSLFMGLFVLSIIFTVCSGDIFTGVLTVVAGFLLVVLLSLTLKIDKMKANYIESNIAPRAVIIKTPKGFLNAKVKDIMLLKTGKVSVNTENEIVITDFESIKLL